jgi:hypothetical protein
MYVNNYAGELYMSIVVIYIVVCKSVRRTAITLKNEFVYEKLNNPSSYSAGIKKEREYIVLLSCYVCRVYYDLFC